jgi:hypothetical protein
MSLSETVSAAGLAVYAEAGLVLFFAAFVAILLQVLSKRTAADLHAASALPFDDGATPSVSMTRKNSEVSRHGQ